MNLILHAFKTPAALAALNDFWHRVLSEIENYSLIDLRHGQAGHGQLGIMPTIATVKIDMVRDFRDTSSVDNFPRRLSHHVPS
jgi:hypothetical protein